MRSPAGIPCIGSWKTTRSIGRECKAGDRLSRPVLTAERLDHPDPAPPREQGGTIAAARSARHRTEPRRTCSRSTRVADSACRSIARSIVSTDPPESSRPAGLNPPAGRFPGDHTRGATPVPIPNTAVKPAGPMIVQSRESRSSPGSSTQARPSPKDRRAFFCALRGSIHPHPDLRPNERPTELHQV